MYLTVMILSLKVMSIFRQAKAWTDIYWLLIIYKSDLSYKIKLDFSPAVVVSLLLNGCTTSILTKHTNGVLNKNAKSYTAQILEVTLNETTAAQPLNAHCKNHPSKTNKAFGPVLEKKKDEPIVDVLQWNPNHVALSPPGCIFT